MPGIRRPGLDHPSPAAWSPPKMPFAGTVIPAPPTRYSPPLPHPPALRSLTTAPAAPPASGEHMPVSATLAANEALAARRSRGEPVLPLAFGEAGLPVPAALRD